MSALDHEGVRSHYESDAGGGELLSRVMRLVEPMLELETSAAGPGDGVNPLTTPQLAALDQFHVRGLVATAELAQLAQPAPGMQVLDAGCGLGGPARYLASQFGCSVLGIDLSAPFVEVARWLALKSDVADRVQFEVGDMTALPLDDSRFDLVWTQHAVMNVRDRHRAYAEFRRVLKPGGRLVCYDVVAADDKPGITYPVPWASGPRANHLLTQAETVDALARAGFELQAWNDVTALALNWFGQPMPVSPQGLSLAAVMGSRFHEMVRNLGFNLQQGRVRLAMARFDRFRA